MNNFKLILNQLNKTYYLAKGGPDHVQVNCS